MKKICRGCKLAKRKSDFGKNERVNGGFLLTCKQCIYERQKLWNKNNRSRIKGYKLKTNYGINLEQYQDLMIKQGNKCAICERSDGKMVLDHCHKTGVVRGILCFKCNVILGFCNDYVPILEAAIEYIKRFK